LVALSRDSPGPCNNYWIGPKKYSRCVQFAEDLLSSLQAKTFYDKADLITFQGKFYQQKYKRLFHRDEYHDCEEGGFLHVQAMKKNSAFSVPNPVYDGLRCKVLEVHPEKDPKRNRQNFNVVALSG